MMSSLISFHQDFGVTAGGSCVRCGLGCVTCRGAGSCLECCLVAGPVGPVRRSWGARFVCAGLRKTSLVRCPCAFRRRRLAQNVGNGLVLSEGLLFSACGARFLSYVIFRGRRETSGAFWGHRTLFNFILHPRGRRGALCMLRRGSKWQLVLDMWQAQYSETSVKSVQNHVKHWFSDFQCSFFGVRAQDVVKF